MTDLLKDTEAFLALDAEVISDLAKDGDCRAADLLRRWRAEVEKREALIAFAHAELAALRPYKEAWETVEKNGLTLTYDSAIPTWTCDDGGPPLYFAKTPLAAVQNAISKMKGKP